MFSSTDQIRWRKAFTSGQHRPADDHHWAVVDQDRLREVVRVEALCLGHHRPGGFRLVMVDEGTRIDYRRRIRDLPSQDLWEFATQDPSDHDSTLRLRDLKHADFE